ncbi:hypothetical protein QIW53_07350 [Pseudomonas fluorescens]|uniref:hypothetical protein n=1 Tax=Pseudomonas fluorescens TaxID=294 RepID=UPI003526682B
MSAKQSHPPSDKIPSSVRVGDTVTINGQVGGALMGVYAVDFSNPEERCLVPISRISPESFYFVVSGNLISGEIWVDLDENSPLGSRVSLGRTVISP